MAKNDKGMRTQGIQPNPNDVILTPAEAGELFNVSEWAMYKRAKKGQAPGHYVGRRLYFVKSELIGFIQNL